MGDWTVPSGTGIRFDGQAQGRLAGEAACLIVVDVLSFTTAVSIAAERGIRVLPFWLPDSRHHGRAGRRREGRRRLRAAIRSTGWPSPATP